VSGRVVHQICTSLVLTDVTPADPPLATAPPLSEIGQAREAT
jgi:hypothetical protein